METWLDNHCECVFNSVGTWRRDENPIVEELYDYYYVKMVMDACYGMSGVATLVNEMSTFCWEETVGMVRDEWGRMKPEIEVLCRFNLCIAGDEVLLSGGYRSRMPKIQLQFVAPNQTKDFDEDLFQCLTRQIGLWIV